MLGSTWHLSVIDAGQPRAVEYGSALLLHSARMPLHSTAWSGAPMVDGTVLLAGPDGQIVRRTQFGKRHGRPVTGDFNGDGITDVGMFLHGEWFIDVNGNGQWDAADLWAKLGHDGDLPVTGDWDGDGKLDIGIFGPAWPGDPRAVAAEPGLPGAHNPVRGPQKNVPPAPDRATLGARRMKLTSRGQLRSDLIDHVFHYGTLGDEPVTGDWNGDGVHTIGVYRNGLWHLDVDGDGRWSPGDVALQYGRPGDKPVVGDWNGDGVDDVGVFRAGTWHLDTDGNGRLDAHDKVLALGTAGDQPIVGDWDGDGADEPGVYQAGGDAASDAASDAVK